MPKTKLTLSVDEATVERAKRFSQRHHTSVSRLVSQFLASLDDSAAPAAPITARLRGVLPEDVTTDEYRRHLEAKHQ